MTTTHTATTCPHCSQPTLMTVIDAVDPTVHCINRLCGGYLATMRYSQFAALTDLEARKCGRDSADAGDSAQVDFEKRVAEIVEAAAKREACRARGEKCFG